jgi:hypothetical protein
MSAHVTLPWVCDIVGPPAVAAATRIFDTTGTNSGVVTKNVKSRNCKSKQKHLALRNGLHTWMMNTLVECNPRPQQNPAHQARSRPTLEIEMQVPLRSLARVSGPAPQGRPKPGPIGRLSDVAAPYHAARQWVALFNLTLENAGRMHLHGLCCSCFKASTRVVEGNIKVRGQGTCISLFVRHGYK